MNCDYRLYHSQLFRSCSAKILNTSEGLGPKKGNSLHLIVLHFYLNVHYTINPRKKYPVHKNFLSSSQRKG